MKTRNIMLVNGHGTANAELHAMLASLGHDVTLAHGVPDALALLGTVNPDLVLLPPYEFMVHGFEFLRRLQSRPETRDTPIVVLPPAGTAERTIGTLNLMVEPPEPAPRLEVEEPDDAWGYFHAIDEAVSTHRTELRQAYRKISHASLETIHRLARAAEYRDEETGAHIARMSRYASSVARRMGLGEEVAESILHAAPMHDVGKIGIPDRILLKPGPLTTDEMRVMRGHTTIGGRILEGSDCEFIRLAERIAVGHHERWDGLGYPAGLAGKAIPIENRIVALADFFDALTTPRPYRPVPTPFDEACSLVREGRGARFNPAVVDAFFSIMDEVSTIHRTHRDRAASPLARVVEGEGGVC